MVNLQHLGFIPDVFCHTTLLTVDNQQYKIHYKHFSNKKIKDVCR